MSRRFILLVLLCVAIFGVLPASAQDTECAEGTYLVTHTLGDTCVPEGATRVVTLDHALTELTLTVGVQPVGVADIARFEVLVDFPVPLDESVVDVGTRNEPSLEVLTGLQPDVIFASSFRVSENYDDLSAIAPVITFDGADNLEGMIGMLTTIATALDREAEAQAALEAMEAHFAAAAAAIEAAGLASNTFIVSQNWVEDSLATFRLFTDGSMAVEVLESIGLENTWDGEPNPDGFTQVGLEAFDGIGDTNFLYITDEASTAFLADSEIWQALPFVAAGHDYWLGENVWLFGGPTSVQRMVTLALNALGVELSPAAEATPEATEAA